MRVESAVMNISGNISNHDRSKQVADEKLIKSILFLGIRTVSPELEEKRKVDIFI